MGSRSDAPVGTSPDVQEPLRHFADAGSGPLMQAVTLRADEIIGVVGGQMASRVCLPTSRRFTRRAYQTAHKEAQDVLAGPEVELIELEARAGLETRHYWQQRLMYRDVSRKLAFANPGLEPVRLTRDYDLLVVLCQTYAELFYVNAVQDLKDRCKTTVCWIDELFAADLPRFKYWLPSLRRFDHVVVGMNGTVKALAEAIDRPCHYVPGAVDAIRFSPYPHRPQRVIDVYSVGRRAEGPHRALLDMAASKRLFYVFDSLHSGESIAADYRQHRDLYANVAKRSRYFMVAPGKFDQPHETAGQIEVGFRFYEGAAAGCVLVGQAPRCEPFDRMFDWPDAVVEVASDGSDMADVLMRLNADPERIREIGRRNAVESLLRHDWVYRWKQIFEIAGVTPTQGMQSRELQLKRLAELSVDDRKTGRLRSHSGQGLEQHLIPMQQLKERALRGGLAKVCSQGTILVVRLGTLVVLARLIDPKDFGLVG